MNRKTNRIQTLPPLPGTQRERAKVADAVDDGKFDLILVSTSTNRFDRKRSDFENHLRNRYGITVQKLKTSSDNFEFVGIRTPFESLLLAAENIGMRLPIKKIERDESKELQTSDKNCCESSACSWFRKLILYDRISEKDNAKYATALYFSHNQKFEEFYRSTEAKNKYFTPTERTLLTYELLSRVYVDLESEQNPKTDVIFKWQGIDRLVEKNVYDDYFPLHEELRPDFKELEKSKLNIRETLRRTWATWRCCFNFQPMSLIRSYFGETEAFYFAFFGAYNHFLILPSLVGIIIFIYGASTVQNDRPTSDICGDFGLTTYMCPRCDKYCPFWKLSDSCPYAMVSYVFDNTATLAFAILMSLWARWFVEYWKRQEYFLQYEWDSINYEKNQEPIRPEYEQHLLKKGKTRKNIITGENERYLESETRFPAFIAGFLFISAMVVIIAALIFGTIVYRVQIDYRLKQTSAKNFSSIITTVTSALISLLLTIPLTKLCYWVARKLTDLEMHKYQSAYGDSYTLKVYLFQFVNYYSSLFYVAFFKGRFLEYPSTYGETGASDFKEQCDPGGCLLELSIQLLTIMVGTQIIANIYEFSVAIFGAAVCPCRKDSNSVRKYRYEKDNELNKITMEFLFDEYLELVIQFGFITLFAVAFPLAPLFALLNNLIELRLDAWKFLTKYKRPIPRKASDIGSWNKIISAVAYLAVVTNGMIIAWTSDFIPRITYQMGYSKTNDLVDYVGWTLSSFPIADYNRTGTMNPDVPSGLTYCRYRDFRESVGPSYNSQLAYWHVTAARLAFVVAFEHLIFFLVYAIQLLVPDVPKKVQDEIEAQRLIDQRIWFGDQSESIDRAPSNHSGSVQNKKVDTSSTMIHVRINETSKNRKRIDKLQ